MGQAAISGRGQHVRAERVPANTPGNVLVTGNLGYVGSVLTGTLRRRRFHVTGLDIGYFKGCEFSAPAAPHRQIIKDIRTIEREDVAGTDFVVHLAGLSNDPLGQLDPGLTDAINRDGSIRAAEVAKAAGVKRFVFASSCSIYGAAGNQPVDEAGEVRPLSAYARSKVEAERAIEQLADDSFTPVFLRKATIYGLSPALRFDLVLNNLLGWAITTGAVRLMSDGSQWRPLLHVQDACNAYLAALTAPRELVHKQAFNIGRNAENYRIRELAQIVCGAVPGSKLEVASAAAADPRSYKVSFDKAASCLLGFRPRHEATTEAETMYGRLRTARLSYEQFQGRRYNRLAQVKFLMETGALTNKLAWRRGAP